MAGEAAHLDLTPAIEARGLVRTFGSLTAVAGLDLTVPRGAFYGFLGPNGAGKTTTMRMLTGLLNPTTGEVRIDGLRLRDEPMETRRRIGVLPDDLALFDRLSIWEHLTMLGPVYGLSVAETARRGGDLLRMLDLWDSRGTLAADCSTGMKKKLALALALIHSPRVLFLDEPFEGIDPVSGRAIRDLLLGLPGRGITVFMTSHILEVVERLADRVGIIVGGKLVREASRAEMAAKGIGLDQFFAEAVGLPGHPVSDLPWLG